MATNKNGDGELRHLAPGVMRPYPGLNPRRRFDEAKHQELVVSLQEHGNFQPVLVTPAPQSGALAEDGVEWWICAGERRWRAAEDAGVDLLCLIRPLNYDEALELAGLENLHRDDLTPVEQARWMRKMLELPDMTQAALAEKIGCAPPHISNRLRLLQLPEQALELVDEGIIGATHARDLLVPFASIRIDRVREALFAGIAERARKTAKQEGGSVPGSSLHRIVSDVALEHSQPIKRAGYLDGSDPLFEESEHEDCTCGAPAWKYQRWGVVDKEVRCFDEQWWNKAQKQAKKRADRERAEAEKKIRAQAEKLDGQEVLEADQVDRVHPGHRDKVTIARRGGHVGKKAQFAPGVLIDPSRLPEDSLLVVKPRYGGLELVCTKVGSVNAAKGQVTREKKVLAEELREAQRKKDLAAAGKKKLEPWMLRLLANEAGKSHQGQMPPICRAAIDLGLIDDPGYRWIDLEKEGGQLTEEQTETLIKVFGIRHKRGEFGGWKEAFEEAAEEQLRGKYEPLLQELLPEPPAENGKKPKPKKKRKRARKKAGV